jgi:hypothetical protein
MTQSSGTAVCTRFLWSFERPGTTVTTSVTLVEIWNCRNLRTVLLTARPHMIALTGDAKLSSMRVMSEAVRIEREARRRRADKVAEAQRDRAQHLRGVKLYRALGVLALVCARLRELGGVCVVRVVLAHALTRRPHHYMPDTLLYQNLRSALDEPPHALSAAVLPHHDTHRLALQRERSDLQHLRRAPRAVVRRPAGSMAITSSAVSVLEPTNARQLVSGSSPSNAVELSAIALLKSVRSVGGSASSSSVRMSSAKSSDRRWASIAPWAPSSSTAVAARTRFAPSSRTRLARTRTKPATAAISLRVRMPILSAHTTDAWRWS